MFQVGALMWDEEKNYQVEQLLESFTNKKVAKYSAGK